ncbi:phage tail tape measure protein [Paenibacillus sp. FSL E2-8871]|uniref:phage tail tape measure protein n=1 Tax=Paenibacillus sp. FSL E2-8871 TaxID=2975326 RepID=UPI0030FC54D0
MAGRSREYDIAFRLNGLMDPSFRQSMGNAERHIEELERALREMSRRGDLDDVRRDADRTDDSLRNLRDSAGGFGDTLRQVAEYTGAFALIQGAAGGMQNIVGVIADQSDAMAQLQAATGVTAEEMLAMRDSAESLYNDRLGEDFNDLGSALATVRQVSQASGAELEKMTKNAIVFRDVFGEDITQSIKASDTMMRNFRITSEQSYNLLAQGAQKGLNKSDELIDTANEYSVYFDTLGYSAEEMFNQFSAGLDAGAFNLDKVGDAVKEFGIRIKDGSASTQTAMAMLFAPDDIEEFTQKLTKGSSKSAEYMELLKHVSKDTAAELVKNLKSGGTKSAKAYEALQGIMGKGNDILGGLADGSVKGKDAMQQIIDKLGEIQDPIQKSTIGVALFGTQFEDMESGVIAALGTAREQFDMTKATMEEVAKVKYDTLSKDFQAVGRQLMTELVIPIGEDLMPALQNFADWMGDNTEILKAIALAAPAALIGKSVTKIVKGFGTITTAADGAGGAAGGFTKALALLTNPVGLAVTGVAALTLGVMAYKKHQEDARQELIHMGDELKESSKQYEEASSKAKLTNNLLWEYDQLSKKIADSASSSEDLAGSSAELTAQQERLKEITQQLQDMFPETISQHDIEIGKLREKAGLAKEMASADEKIAKLQLEKNVTEGKQKLPETVAEIQRLQEQTEATQAQKDALDVAIPALKEYAAEFENLKNADPSDELSTRLTELVQKVNEVGSTVGYNFAGAFQLDGLDKAIEDLTNRQIDSIDTQITKLGDLDAAQQTYQELYEQQLKLIELNLGGTLEVQSKKFIDLSDEEKKRFGASLADVQELNEQMLLLPTEKQINIELLYSQTGLYTPKAPNTVTEITNSLLPKQFRMDQYADGGIATKPSIFGEAGPEIAIPINNKPRSRSLLDMANDMMGYTKNENREGDIIIHNAPVITLPGADPSVMKLVKEALKQSEDNLERKLKAIVEQQRRVSFQ